MFSIDVVRDEIAAGNDDLADWAKAHSKKLFLGRPANVAPSLAMLSQWAASGKYDPSAISTFFSSADYFLIAYAHVLGYSVVSLETSSPDSKRRIKIPDACKALSVPCATTFQMLEAEKALFVL